MNRGRLRGCFRALLGVGALGLLLASVAWAAPAATVPRDQAPAGHRTCPFPVTIFYNTFVGPPGAAQAKWGTPAASCPSKLRVEIKSNAGFIYRSGWVVSTNTTTVTKATATDGTQLQWARLEVQVTATGTVYCDRVYATVGDWRVCTNPAPPKVLLTSKRVTGNAICQHNGNHLCTRIDGPLSNGDQVKFDIPGNARNLYWDVAGTDANGVPVGYVQTFDGHFLQGNGVGGFVDLVDHTNGVSGVVWNWVNGTYLTNRAASGGALHYGEALASDNMNGDRARIEGTTGSGFYTAMDWAGAPIKQAKLAAARGLAPGCQHVLWTAGDANRPGVLCFGLKRPPAGQEWNLVLDGTTSFTIHKGSVVEAFAFTPGQRTRKHGVLLTAPGGMHLVPAGVTTSHGKRISWYHICTYTEQGLCLLANGAGNNVTIANNGYNKWQAIPDGGPIEWQNGSGNCLKAQANTAVTVTSGACDGGASKDWTVGGSGNVTFHSSYAGGYMGINAHPFNGALVSVDPAQQGFYYGWITFGCC